MSRAPVDGCRRAALPPAARMAAMLCAILGATPATAAGQSLAARVARASGSGVRMSYDARPDACGFGSSIGLRRRGDSLDDWGQVIVWGDLSSARGDFSDDCVRGPVRVDLTVDGKRTVIGLRAYVGGAWEPGPGIATDLGHVPASEAAEYLLGLAATAVPRVSERAVLAAALAEGATVWPALFPIARDRSRSEGTREQARFWLFDAAAARVEREARGEAGGAVGEARATRSVQSQAVFALSRLPDDEGLSALLQLARAHRDWRIRRDALFWLSQSDDARAVDLFESILRR